MIYRRDRYLLDFYRYYYSVVGFVESIALIDTAFVSLRINYASCILWIDLVLCYARTLRIWSYAGIRERILSAAS
jgi:hypothetical protein